MAIIHALEELDESLEITKVINKDLAEESLPEHDQLYLDKAQEVEEEAKAKEAEVPEDDSDAMPVEDTETTAPENGSGDSEDPPEDRNDADPADDEDAGEDEEMENINGKLTTVATEAMRVEDYYDRVVMESFEEGSALGRMGSMAFSGVKAVSGYALHLATELGSMLKEAGIKYGPTVFAKLRSGVSYILTRVFRSFSKMKAAATRSYFQHSHSFKRHKARVDRLKQTLAEIPDDFVLAKAEPFSDQSIYDLFEVGGSVSARGSVSAINGLMDVVVSDIDAGIHNELNVMKQVIEVCRRNARVEVMHYLHITGLSSAFLKRTVTGYDQAPEHVETFVYTKPLPRKVLLLAGIPRKDVVLSGAKTGDLAEISKAYQESFMVLGVNPVASKSIPMVNYMDKKALLTFVGELEAIVNKGIQHVSFYKKLEDTAESLKPSFQNYFSWLVEDQQSKDLRTSLAEVIYLKQSFVTKVYLPGAIDIHEFVSNYVASMLRYVEGNIKVLKPAAKELAV